MNRLIATTESAGKASPLTLCWVAQHLVSCAQLLKLAGSVRIVWILVRMHLKNNQTCQDRETEASCHFWIPVSIAADAEMEN